MRNTNLEGMDFAVTETATFQIPAMQEENVLVNPILHQLMADSVLCVQCLFYPHSGVLYMVGVFSLFEMVENILSHINWSQHNKKNENYKCQ